MRTLSVVTALSLAASTLGGAASAQGTSMSGDSMMGGSMSGSSMSGGSMSGSSMMGGSMSGSSMSGGSMMMSGKTIAAIVAGDPQFSTLLTALKAAGLVETLSSGTYTVFAPTNAAFAKVPKATLSKLLADKTALKKVLLDHVVKGKVTAADVMKMTSATAVSGSKLNIKVSGGKVMVDNATVTKANIAASNGVIHVVDAVIMPGM